MENKESFLDGLGGSNIEPPKFYRDLPTTQTRPQYITDSGRLTPFRKEGTTLGAWSNEFVREGQSISGNLGVGDLRSPQGVISDSVQRGFVSSYYSGLDVEAQKRLDPSFDPVPEDQLESVSGHAWFSRSVPQSYKNFIGQYGYTEDFFKDGTGTQARKKYEQALFMSRLNQQEEQFQESAGWFSKTARFIGADIVAAGATDPFTWLTLGIGGAAKTAAVRGTVVALGKTEMGAGFTRALSNRWINYGLAGAANAAQFGLQASEQDQKKTVDPNTYTPEGVVLSFALGTGLTWGMDELFTGVSKAIANKTNQTISQAMTPAPGINANVPVSTSTKSVIKAAQTTIDSGEIAKAMKDLTGSELAFHHYWGEAELAELNSVGVTAQEIVGFLRKNPTDEEVDTYFSDAFALVNSKKSPDPAVSPTKLINEHQVYRGLPNTPKGVALKFQSAIDKAFYVLSTKTKNVELIRQAKSFLRQQFPQLSDVELNAFVQRVNMSIKDAVHALGENKTGKSREVEIPGGLWQRVVNMPTKGALPTHVFENLADLRGRSTAYSRIRPQYDALIAQRNSILASGVDTPELQRKLQQIGRKISAFGEEMNRIRKGTRGPVPRADIDIPEPPLGQYLTALDSSKRLDQLMNDGKIRIRNYTARLTKLGGIIPAWVKKPFIAMTSGMAGNDWHRLIYSPYESVRNLAYLIQGGPLSEESGKGVTSRTLSLEESRNRARAFTSQYQNRVLQIERKYKLSRTQVDAVEADVVSTIMGGTSTLGDELSKPAKELETAVREYFDYWGQRAQKAGVIPAVSQNYFPSYIRSKFYHKAGEIADLVWKNWVKAWTKDDADLHVLTLERIGMLDEDGKFNLTRINERPDVKAGIEAFIRSQNPGLDKAGFAKAAAEMSTFYGPKGPKKLSDLLEPHRKAYLEELTRPSGPIGSDDIGGSLRIQADQYVRTRMGHKQVHDYVKHGATNSMGESKASTSLNLNHAKAREIDENVWLDPGLQPFIETHLPLVMQRYSDTFGYRTVRQEVVNGITGQRGISWENFFQWYKASATRGRDAPEVQALDAAFEAIDLKEKHLQGVNPIDDNESFKPYDVLATSTINLSRSVISAKNAFNQVAVETMPLITMGGLDIGRFFNSLAGLVDTIRGNKKVLAGYSYFMEHNRTLASRNVYDGDQANSYSRNWLEQGFLNPAARLGQIFKSPGTPVSSKLAEGVISLTDGVAQMSRVASFEDAVNTGYKAFAVGGEVYSFSKNYKGMVKLAQALKGKSNLSPKEFNGLCRHAGIDPIYARRLNDAGLLDEAAVSMLELMNKKNPKFLSQHQRGSTLDADEFSNIFEKLDPAVRAEAGETYAKAVAFIERMVDNVSVRPGLQDISSRAAARTPFGRIFRAFTTWTTAYFNRAVMDRAGNAPWYKAYGMIGLAAFGEMAYLEANKVLYRGYNPSEIAEEWRNEPYNVLYQAGLRSHLLGPLGDMGMLVAAHFGEFDTGYKGSSTTGMAQENAIRTFKSISNIAKSGFSSDIDADATDVNRVMRLMPLMNSPAMQFLAKAFGHRTPAGFIMDDDESPLAR